MLNNQEVTPEQIEKLMENAKKYGTQEQKQVQQVEKLITDLGDKAKPIGVAYYIGVEGTDKILCIDPWANTIEYKRVELAEKAAAEENVEETTND